MAKVKTSFFCQNCGAQSPKWVGKCSSCNEWNTYVEEIIDKTPKSATPFSSSTTQRAAKAHNLSQVEQKVERRINLQDGELNWVLGGGMVPGSLILFGGEPTNIQLDNCDLNNDGNLDLMDLVELVNLVMGS